MRDIVDWGSLLGFLIAGFSFGNVVVYALCIMRSKNWRRVLWGGILLGSIFLCVGYIGLLTGVFTTDNLGFLIRPAILVIIVSLFAFGIWELWRGSRE